MKNLIKPLFIILVLIIFSCDTNNSSNTMNDEDNMEQELNENEGSISVINAFPNLSFAQPLDLQVANDGSNRIFIAEKAGVIRVFENESSINESNIFLDLGAIASSSEQGLLGFAFHPNFQSNGYVYVYYTPNSNFAFVSRFTLLQENSQMADLNSELVILEIPQPQTNHNGGQLTFGPDGYLYVAVGDGGGGGDPDGNAQNRSNLLGNILRIDIDDTQEGLNYAIPVDNPFANEPNLRSEIYAFGFRNPWRMSFDSQTGKLWTGDVGQGEIEEIDVVTLGGNYGWNLFEGTACFSGNCDNTNLIPPVFEYVQDNGDRSITGGYVYHGSSITSIRGKYVYGDFVSGRIWALNEDGSANELITESRLSIASFGTDANEELYILAFDGSIYKLIESD